MSFSLFIISIKIYQTEFYLYQKQPPSQQLNQNETTDCKTSASCELFDIFKNTYFEEHLPTAASVQFNVVSGKSKKSHA